MGNAQVKVWEEDTNEIRQERAQMQREKEVWDGYTAPRNENHMTQTQLYDIKRQIDLYLLLCFAATPILSTIECQDIRRELKPGLLANRDLISICLGYLQPPPPPVFKVHHPYYRKLLREWWFHNKEFSNRHSDGSAVMKSVHWSDHDTSDDTSLLMHKSCKKAMPMSQVVFYPDRDSEGGVYQSQASCLHCDRYILSDSDDCGYSVVHGKNAVIVGLDAATVSRAVRASNARRRPQDKQKLRANQLKQRLARQRENTELELRRAMDPDGLYGCL